MEKAGKGREKKFSGKFLHAKICYTENLDFFGLCFNGILIVNDEVALMMVAFRYPSTYTPSSTGTCVFTVSKVSSEVCQVFKIIIQS